MNKLSFISEDKRIKLTFLDYNTVVIQDKEFKDTVLGKTIPVLAEFDEDKCAWVYVKKYGIHNFFGDSVLVDPEMTFFIDTVKNITIKDMGYLFNGSADLNEDETLNVEEW